MQELTRGPSSHWHYLALPGSNPPATCVVKFQASPCSTNTMLSSVGNPAKGHTSPKNRDSWALTCRAASMLTRPFQPHFHLCRVEGVWPGGFKDLSSSNLHDSVSRRAGQWTLFSTFPGCRDMSQNSQESSPHSFPGPEKYKKPKCT